MMGTPMDAKALIKMVVELEGQRDALIKAIGRVGAGLPVPLLTDAAPAIVADAIEALERFRVQHAEMTGGLDAFNTMLGRAAARAGEGRLLELNEEPGKGKLLTPEIMRRVQAVGDAARAASGDPEYPALYAEWEGEWPPGTLYAESEGVWAVQCVRCGRIHQRVPAFSRIEAVRRMQDEGWKIETMGWECAGPHEPR